MPVWAHTPALSAMTHRTLEIARAVRQVPTEFLVIDNGSPYPSDWPAQVHRWPENKGVAPAWNMGAEMAIADVLCFLNNDCEVTPGWDTALVACAKAGHVAFPFTDEGDGPAMSFGNVTGWCFVMTDETFQKVGPFDESFVPAQYEDTDWFHRAHDLGIPLTPVPAAVVKHRRKITTGAAWGAERYDWLHLANRFRYGWKHNVNPIEPPPFYSRAVTPWEG